MVYGIPVITRAFEEKKRSTVLRRFLITKTVAYDVIKLVDGVFFFSIHYIGCACLI